MMRDDALVPAPARPIRVLHLEDSAQDAEIVRYKLNAGGIACEIVLASTREAFEAALSQRAFDLVLCDYNLPDYDGARALSRIREIQPQTPVIIISGTVGEDEAVKCLHAGATDYLLKQHLERLAPAVTRALQEAEEHRKRVRAEEALQQRERRLSSIYEAVADILFHLEVDEGPTFRFVSVNPAFVSATGLDYSRVVGKRVEQVIPKAVVGVAVENYTRAIRERRIVRWEETAQYPKGLLTGEVSVAPVFDASGTCTHLVGAVHDVTERRQLEIQLRQVQKMESVGQLAGGIAHDFNNLLTVITGMADLALDQVPDDGHELRADLHEIQRAGERAGALTRQLLAFSRKQILQLQVLDLDAIVAELGSMLRRLLGEDIDLVIAPAQGMASIKADRGQIEQVIVNLAVNARDAMPQGGTLTIKTGRVDIDERRARDYPFAVVPGPYVVLEMRDIGCGMDEATRQRMFEPFFTTKGPGQGTGLGLSTVYGIVKQSGGFICVESEPGSGSCFTVHLPHAPEAARDQPGAPPAMPQNVSKTETVLVVEDVDGLRRFLTRALESSGYRVLSAGSGEDALQLLEGHEGPVDVMITDVVMPGMNGRDLAERVKLMRPEVKVLYMSGYTDDVVVRKGVLQEGVRMINKPFSTADLIRGIREALDGGA